MKKLVISILVLNVLFSLGCATSKGRFSLVDVDLRTPEQILAYQNEADIVYLADGVTPAPATLSAVVPVPAPWYDIVVKIVEVIKGRVRILSFEWKK